MQHASMAGPALILGAIPHRDYKKATTRPSHTKPEWEMTPYVVKKSTSYLSEHLLNMIGVRPNTSLYPAHNTTVDVCDSLRRLP